MESALMCILPLFSKSRRIENISPPGSKCIQKSEAFSKKETHAVGEYADPPLTCCLQKLRIPKKPLPRLDLIASRNEGGFRKKETPAKWKTPLFSKIRITKKKRPRLDLIESRNERGFRKKETPAKWETPLFSKIRITKKKRPRLDLIASRNEGGFRKKETPAKWEAP